MATTTWALQHVFCTVCAVCYITSLYFNNKSDLCNISAFFSAVLSTSLLSAGSTALPCVTSTRSALELNLVP